MRALTRPLAVAALGLGALLASPAEAASCVGEDTLLYLCAHTPDVTPGTRTLCVYAGGDTCTEVDVPNPSVSGAAGTTCGGYACPDTHIAGCRDLTIEPVCN